MDYKTLLLSAQGRIGRKTYWLTGIAVGVVMVAVLIIANILYAATMGPDGSMGVVAMAGYAIAAVVVLVGMWSAICLGFKRCHDRDMSGWMMLIPFYNIWVMIQVYFLPGTPGPNRFGPDPLGAPALGYSVA